MNLRAYKKDKEQIITHNQIMLCIRNGVDVFNDPRYIVMLESPYQDKNCSPIFESDVIETISSKKQRFCYEVVIDKVTGNWMAEPFMKGRSSIKFGYTAINSLQDLKLIMEDESVVIIGNKYKNPELYKKML